MSHLAVLRASLAHPLGRKLVGAFGTPLTADPRRAAQVMAALSSCLYYEDSMYAGHVTHASVGVPLAFRRVQRLNGRALLTAVVAANECAARVTAACALGPLRGQGTSYTQLVGAVAARLHGARAQAGMWTNAWGLALATPPWPLRRALLGSEAKVLSAATPVRTALDACDAAAAGLRGAEDILEHPGGLLAKFSDVPSPEAVTAGLGTRWHTETLTFKLNPAGAYVDAAVDCASQLHARLSREELHDIEEIVVSAARLTIAMDQEGAPYVDRDRSAIMALNVSVAYNVATALTTGAVVPADLAEAGDRGPSALVPRGPGAAGVRPRAEPRSAPRDRPVGRGAAAGGRERQTVARGGHGGGHHGHRRHRGPAEHHLPEGRKDGGRPVAGHPARRPGAHRLVRAAEGASKPRDEARPP